MFGEQKRQNHRENSRKKLLFFITLLFGIVIYLFFQAHTSSPIPTPISIPTPTPTLIPTSTPTPTPQPTSTPTPPPPTPTLMPSTSYESYFDQYSNQYKVSKDLLKKIAFCESGVGPGAKNGDYGGMYQFTVETWTATRKSMGLDANPDLRFGAGEAIETAAYKIANGGVDAWANCK